MTNKSYRWECQEIQPDNVREFKLQTECMAQPKLCGCDAERNQRQYKYGQWYKGATYFTNNYADSYIKKREIDR